MHPNNTLKASFISFTRTKQYTPLESNFVFPSLTKTGHINRDSISNAIRDIGGREKYNSKASAHGLEPRLKTICLYILRIWHNWA